MILALLGCVDDKAAPDIRDSGDPALPYDAPAWVPDFTSSAEAPEAGEGGVLVVPLILAEGGGVVALDAGGEVVWAYPATDAPLRAPPMRARFSLDGTAILFNHSARSADDPSQIHRVPLDGGEAGPFVGITGGHTDFVEYTPGGYATLGWEIRELGDRKILGDTIVERAPDGAERVVWSAWDDFTPDLMRTYARMYPADADVEDWTHINGISYDATEDAYYVSMTFNNGLARIDRATGTMAWFLGDPDGGDFTLPRGERLPELPHSAMRVEGGVLTFSRGNPNDPTACSEAVEFALDEAAGEARRAWSYVDPACLLVTYLGGAERLPGGNTLITWTTAGQIDQVTPDGEVAWRVNTPLGHGIGFASWTPELGASTSR